MKYLLFIIVFISMVWFFSWLGNSPDPFINEIEAEFKGKIIDKFYSKTTHLIIDKNSGGSVDISSLSRKLINQSEIGDSIVKYKNMNCCLLIGDSTVIMEYLYVPKGVLEDSRWTKKAEHLIMDCLANFP